MELLSIARKAENGDKFKRLFEGDIAGYTSQSEADMALCCMLAFYCANDENKIDNLFRHSGLIRAKWDEKRGNLTYGQITINEAIKRTNNFYSPQKKYNINFTSGEKLKKNIKKLHLGDADFKFLNEKTLELYLKEKNFNKI